MEGVKPAAEWVTCVVAAPGPSLTLETAAAVEACGLPVLAVNDAYKRLPGARVLYACDAVWWRERAGALDFAGERWSSIGEPGPRRHNEKTAEQHAYGLRLVYGREKPYFSTDPAVIHYGNNSGFQAVNLALHFGARTIVLVGFDMAGSHFFGAHKEPLRNTGSYAQFIRAFHEAAKRLPSGVRVFNASPGSALTCFPRMTFDAALSKAFAENSGAGCAA